MSDVSMEAVTAARAKMLEGLNEYVAAIADDGEPEVVDSAVMLFESRGMADSGIFSRTTYVFVEQSGVTTMLGMIDLGGHKARAAVREYATGCEE